MPERVRSKEYPEFFIIESPESGIIAADRLIFYSFLNDY